MCESSRIKILIANDHKIIREGLQLLFNNNSDTEVLGEDDSDSKSFVQLSNDLKPDVIITDVNSSGEDNIELSKQILNDNRNIRIVFHPDRMHMHLISQAIKAGITGFVLKECGFEELVCAVRTVYKNKIHMCPQIKDYIANGYVNLVQSELDEKEYEIIRFLSLGMTSKEIALRMDISSKTVDAYRRQIMKKLKINSIAELTKYAIRVGLTGIDY